MRRLLLLVAWVGSFTAWAQTVEVLRDTGPSANRIDLVILGDGYRATDQAKFTTDATALMNALLTFEPYAQYAPVVSVKLIHADSNENGADQGSYGTMRDTRYGAYFKCAGIDRLICFDTAAVNTDLFALAPEADVTILLVNDPKYGGSGGSTVAMSTNVQSTEIVRHELGHSIAHLADEYTSAYPGYPACSTANDCYEPNATLRSTRATLKWNDWVPSSTPVPTPQGSGYNGVGLFEGARYQTSGVYRPVDSSCIMNYLGKPFCPVCAEGMVLALGNLLHFIDGTSIPTGTSEVCTTGGQVELSVDLLPLTGHFTFNRSWKVNGQVVSDAGTLVVPLTGGSQSVEFDLDVQTPDVRTDRLHVLQETAQWTLLPVTCDAGVVDAGSADAGVIDAGVDAGTVDSGVVAAGDAGEADAGNAVPDAGVPDAGPPAPDAGPRVDAGQADAGAPQPMEPAPCGCTMSPVSTALWLSMWLVVRRRRASTLR